MPFKKGDKNINRSGRPKGETLLKMKNKNTLGEDELHKMLRGLKPLSRQALKKFGVILSDESDASETGQIRVAAYVLDRYKELIEQLYLSADEDEEGTAQDMEVAPVFSMKVINKEEK